MRSSHLSTSCPSGGRFTLRRTRSVLATAAAIVALAGASAVRADTLVQSFETGGFDYPGDTGSGVSYGTLSTVGVTEGSFSLHVTSPQSWWTAFGYLDVNATTVASNQILKFDITTSTGVQFIPIFHNNPNVGEPWTGGWNQGPGLFVPAAAGTQTVVFDYSAHDFGGGQIGLPAATTYTLQMQGSTGNAVDFYIDNVRLGQTVPIGGDAQWAVNGNSNWVNQANWSPNNIPGVPGDTATFSTNGGLITTNSQIVVTLDQSITLANMVFDKGGDGYKVAGTFPISLTANANVLSGTHTIAAPFNVASGTIFDVAAGSSLTVDNLGGGGFGLMEKNGAGVLSTDKVVNVSVNLNGGTWALKPGNAQNNGFIYGLTIANGSTFDTGGANVRNNGLYSGTGAGTLHVGAGGTFTTGLFSDYEYFGAITGGGNVQIGGEDTTPHVVTWSGPVSYTGATNVTATNSLIINPAASIGSGVVTASGPVTFTAGNANTQKMATLSIGGTVAVEVNDNDAVFTASDYSTVAGLVSTGRNSGAWGGLGGITSATAAANPQASTTLGVVSGADYISVSGTTFGTATVANSDVLVKYTWYGDTDLTGGVDFDDYVRTDAGFNGGLGGWFNGDFDLNGAIDFDDYVLIDLGFNSQTGTLRRAQDFISGDDRSMDGMDAPALQKVVEHFAQFGTDYGTHFLSAVPEPTGLAVLGVAGALAMSRGRRRARA